MDEDPVWDAVGLEKDERVPGSRANLIVTTSPKVELMLAVAMPAAPTPSPAHYGTLDHPIARAARRWFAPLAEHRAVETVRRLFYAEGGFACDAVTSLVLRRSEPPELAARRPHGRSALARARGDEGELERLLDQLRDFYHASRFGHFWEEHTAAYRAIERQTAGYVREGWAGEDVAATMESYFGEAIEALVLVPTPMERPGGGTMDPVDEDAHLLLASFDCTVRKDWILYLLYHEAGHGFVNPLAERHHALVRRYGELFESLREEMRPWGYVSWPIALNEHVLRAQNCRLRRRLLGDAAAEAQLDREESQGFRYVRALEAKLAEYEAQRAAYPTLADFYPSLLAALDPFLASSGSG